MEATQSRAPSVSPHLLQKKHWTEAELTADFEADHVSLFTLWREDLRAHQGKFSSAGFHAIFVHRLGRRAHRWPIVLKLPALIIYSLLYFVVRNIYGTEIPWSARIGRRFRIAHHCGIVIHHNCRIGNDCIVRQNTTIGAGSYESAHFGPILCDNVELGAGSAVIGKIKVHEGVRLGPGAVAMMNVPAGATVFAPPSRVVVMQRKEN